MTGAPVTRLSTHAFVLGSTYGIARCLLSVLVPLRFLGLVRVSGADGGTMPIASGTGPFAVLSANVGAAWGLLLGASLLALLGAASGRGDRRAWPGLVVWWLVALGEQGFRVAVMFLLGGRDHAVKGLLTGANVVDDACCCTPISVVWLAVLAVEFLVALHARSGVARP